MSAASSRARARKRAACARAGHEHVVLVDGREWCVLCRWWVGTALQPDLIRVPVLLPAHAD